MADFKFYCPHCARHLQAETAWVGITTNCPDCGLSIIIPSPPATILQQQKPAATAAVNTINTENAVNKNSKTPLFFQSKPANKSELAENDLSTNTLVLRKQNIEKPSPASTPKQDFNLQKNYFTTVPPQTIAQPEIKTPAAPPMSAMPDKPAETAEVKTPIVPAVPDKPAETAEVKTPIMPAVPDKSAEIAEVKTPIVPAVPDKSAETAEVKTPIAPAVPDKSAETAEVKTPIVPAVPDKSAETAEVKTPIVPAVPDKSAETAEVKTPIAPIVSAAPAAAIVSDKTDDDHPPIAPVAPPANTESTAQKAPAMAATPVAPLSTANNVGEAAAPAPTAPVNANIASAPEPKSKCHGATFIVSFFAFLLGLAISLSEALPFFRMLKFFDWNIKKTLVEYSMISDLTFFDYITDFENVSEKTALILQGSSIFASVLLVLIGALAIRKKFAGWGWALWGMLIAFTSSELIHCAIRAICTFCKF